MATRNVTDTASFNTQMGLAQAGDVISMATGNYGTLTINKQYVGLPVVIESTTPLSPATIAKITLNNSQNIIFNNVIFDYTYTSGQGSTTPTAKCNNTIDITFNLCVFDGDLVNSGGHGFAVDSIGSTRLKIIDCDMSKWFKALRCNNGFAHEFIGNNVHNLSSDCITAYNMDGLTMEGCFIHDFIRKTSGGAHPDVFQISRPPGSGGKGSKNIIIRNNVIDMGIGTYMQTFYSGLDGGSADANSLNSNVLIHNNLVMNGQPNAILWVHTDGLTVTNNTVITAQSTGIFNDPQINISLGCTNVVISNNITNNIVNTTGATWTVNNNQDVNPGSYSTHFNILKTGTSDGYNDFEVKSVVNISIGCTMTKRVGDWGGAQVAPHPDYLGGFVSGGASVPSQFSPVQWSITNLFTGGDAQVTVTSLPSDNGATITDIEYQIDGGSWVSSGGTTTFTISSGLTDDVESDVSIRAVNTEGESSPSATKPVTTTSSGITVMPSTFSIDIVI